MTPNVPIRETGTATLGIRVVRTSRRNTNTTRMTSAIERRSVPCTSATDARIVVERSTTTVIRMPAGISAWRPGIAALTRSTVSMMLAPG